MIFFGIGIQNSFHQCLGYLIVVEVASSSMPERPKCGFGKLGISGTTFNKLCLLYKKTAYLSQWCFSFAPFLTHRLYQANSAHILKRKVNHKLAYGLTSMISLNPLFTGGEFTSPTLKSPTILWARHFMGQNHLVNSYLCIDGVLRPFLGHFDAIPRV